MSFLRLFTPATIRRGIQNRFEAWRLGQRYRWLRAIQPASAGPRKTVLFVNFGNWVPRAIFDAVLAAAFRMRGCSPVFLTLRECTNVHRTLRALGCTEFLFLDDFYPTNAQEIEDESERILREHATFDSLFSLTEDGIEHGRNVLSTVVKDLKSGGVRFTDPQAQTLLRLY